MKKVDLKSVPKIKTNPIFDGLSDDLKTLKSFKKVEKELQHLVETDHVHKTVSLYVKCPECSEKRIKRQNKIKEFGFKNLSQYMEWKKVMTIISNKQSFKIK